ncbi:MAG: ferredoxin-thioredoxin reductase catalytic domain-containing protein [Thermodesulfobacteriota bacterium]
MSGKKVTLFSLTTCTYCKAFKKMLTDLKVEHAMIDVDLLAGSARKEAIAELEKYNPKATFPTLVVDGTAITGFQVQAAKEALGITTEVDKLHETLKKSQEPKGYFFNKEKEKTFDLLRGLMINKDRYGYMSCPCRLASGVREEDRDIICPCIYREPDVSQYGSCYCGLYVSQEWNKGKIERFLVPERRPKNRN